MFLSLCVCLSVDEITQKVVYEFRRHFKVGMDHMDAWLSTTE